MFFHALTVLVGYMAVASSRETPRPMPTITNSLVNLGKMEIAFYFTGKSRDPPSHAMRSEHGPPPSLPFFPKLDTVIEEPCPCSSLRNAKDSFLPNPANLFSKILANNDLFSSSKDPVRSSLCCDSHEHVVQEGSVFFELTPNQKPVMPSPTRSNVPPMIPFFFDNMIPNKSMLPTKTKAIELFLFPKKKNMSNVISNFDMSKLVSKKKETVPKEGITVVGDKKLENNVNLFKVPPPVKKDLSAQEKNNIKIKENDKPAEEGETIIIEPPSKPNAV